MVFCGMLGSCEAANIVKQNSTKLETIAQNQAQIIQQQTIQTANVLGDSIPEQFYVIKGDTVYQKIDGRPTRQYFERMRGPVEVTQERRR